MWAELSFIKMVYDFRVVRNDGDGIAEKRLK